MSTTNIGGVSSQASAPIKPNQPVENKQAGGKKTVEDVLATLRELMPGWTISTTSADWGDGFRNLQIDPEILQRMADDPKEMEKYKSLILDLENVVSDLEKWAQDNPGQSVIFELFLNTESNTTTLTIVKTLLGAENRTKFELPEDRETWVDIIRDRLDAIIKGQVEDEFGTKSWVT